MSKNSRRTAAANAAAASKVHHVSFEDIQNFTPEKVGHFRRGGIRNGPGRADAEVDMLIDKIPPSQRAGRDGEAAAQQVKEYLRDKDASHIDPHANGGSSHPDNIKWEEKSINRARQDQPMTKQEQVRLDRQAFTENITGSLKAGVAAIPRGAAIGAITTLPFSALRNGLRVVRGELTTQDAALDVGKDTLIGSGVGAASAFTVTAVATACPPIALALSAISPALLVAGGAGMVYEFYKILDDHKQEVRAFYDSMTEQQLAYLKQAEDDLIYEHEKALAMLNEAQQTAEEITNRPRGAGVEGALQRFMESRQMAQTLQASREQRALGGASLKQLPPIAE